MPFDHPDTLLSVDYFNTYRKRLQEQTDTLPVWKCQVRILHKLLDVPASDLTCSIMLIMEKGRNIYILWLWRVCQLRQTSTSGIITTLWSQSGCAEITGRRTEDECPWWHGGFYDYLQVMWNVPGEKAASPRRLNAVSRMWPDLLESSCWQSCFNLAPGVFHKRDWNPVHSGEYEEHRADSESQSRINQSGRYIYI